MHPQIESNSFNFTTIDVQPFSLCGPLKGVCAKHFVDFETSHSNTHVLFFLARSSDVGARHPLARDRRLDYAEDSGDEWDSEPDDAEVLASDDEDDEDEALEADERRADGLEEDGWVSTDSERDDADSDNEQDRDASAAAVAGPAQKVCAPCVPFKFTTFPESQMHRYFC